MKLYAERDIIAQGKAYTNHVQAMTAEALHDKADIAAELAHRDIRIAALEAQLEQARAVLPCGHHHSLLLKSVETGGEPLYCSMCDCMSQRDDANEECGYRIKERDEALAEVERLKATVALAYGHLWHVNNEPATPIPIYTPEKAAYAARKLLRDLLTSEQRGDAINATQKVWGGAARSQP